MFKEKLNFGIKFSASFILPLFLILKYHPDKIEEFIACFALIVALFNERLLNFYLPPRLRVTTSTSKEHFQEVEDRDISTGERIENQYWLSVRVENIGLGIAKNVSVFLNGISSNKITNFEGYKSLQLKRSYLYEPTISSLPPKVGFNFSFCYLSEKNRRKISFNFLRKPNALIDIICEENELSFFKFEIIAISDNAKISRRNILLEFKGNYDKDFKVKML